MFKKVRKNENRKSRHARVRSHLSGTSEKPRLNVYRSANHMYAQLIDDVNQRTLISASSLEKDIKANGYTGNKDAARLVGKRIADKASEQGIKEVVFDRGGYLYHGRVKELAEGAREGGLEF